MPLKLSPEFLVEKLIKFATNRRTLSAKFRRIWTIILVPAWILSIVYIILALIDIKREIAEYNSNSHTYPEYILRHNLRSPLEIIISLILFLIVPWLIIKLIFWVVDADKAKAET